MSLKTVHIFFITVSIALSVFTAAWQIDVAARSGAVLDWFLGALSVFVGLGLICYLVWFVRKMKGLRA